MDADKEIKRVFELFTQNKFKEAQELNNQILEHFPNHMYAKRYQKILSDKINFDNKTSLKKEKSTKVRGKTLKCPHCVAKIPFSGLNPEQRVKIKKGNYNNLEIKCPYCHTNFVLQKRKANSILGIKIGDIANIDGKKYRVTGYVEYLGRWYEDGYSGGVRYLEWLLLGENNEYKYFSEGKSSDDGVWTNEFELSEKYIPKQIGKIDYIRKIANIDGKTLYNKETDKVKVVSVYGENSKNTQVGEKVELYDFGKLLIEKETSGSQSEAGFYKTKELSGGEAARIFGKEYNSAKDIVNSLGKNINSDNIGGLIIFGFVGVSILPFWLIVIGIVGIIGFFIYKNKPSISSSSLDNIGIIPKLIFACIGGLISINFIFTPLFNSILENKQKVEISELKNAKKVELKFKDFSVMKERQTSFTRYDYGGVRTYYSKNIGLKFSVKNDEDKKILEKIQEYRKKFDDNNESMIKKVAKRLMDKNNKLDSYDKLYFSDEEEKIKKMFNGDLYKLK